MPSAYKPPVPKKLRDAVIDAKGRLCTYCGKGPLYKTRLHMDHLVPFSSGGKHTMENLFPCCAKCNQAKQSRSVADYIAHRIPQLERELTMLRALQGLYPKR
jgi:5-methylcytosine-specific restriction endonuclease McrA